MVPIHSECLVALHGLSPSPSWPLPVVDEAVGVTARPWAGYRPWRLAWDLVPAGRNWISLLCRTSVESAGRISGGLWFFLHGHCCLSLCRGLPHPAQLWAGSFVWFSLRSVGPVVCRGWSKALPSWAGTIWAGCHVEHRASSGQLGLVEAGSKSWLVAAGDPWRLEGAEDRKGTVLRTSAGVS